VVPESPIRRLAPSFMQETVVTAVLKCGGFRSKEYQVSVTWLLPIDKRRGSGKTREET
jgi:hypothetical protein